jgi:hypothetical protein
MGKWARDGGRGAPGSAGGACAGLPDPHRPHWLCCLTRRGQIWLADCLVSGTVVASACTARNPGPKGTLCTLDGQYSAAFICTVLCCAVLRWVARSTYQRSTSLSTSSNPSRIKNKINVFSPWMPCSNRILERDIPKTAASPTALVLLLSRHSTILLLHPLHFPIPIYSIVPICSVFRSHSLGVSIRIGAQGTSAHQHQHNRRRYPLAPVTMSGLNGITPHVREM